MIFPKNIKSKFRMTKDVTNMMKDLKISPEEVERMTKDFIISYTRYIIDFYYIPYIAIYIYTLTGF